MKMTASRNRNLAAVLLEALPKGTTASPRAVAEKLGPEWRTDRGRAAVRKGFRRLESSGKLVRVGYGQYTQPAEPKVTSLQFMVTAIAEFMRANGGAAETDEIHRALGSRQEGSSERPYEYVLITRALKETTRFERFAHGHWRLRQEELEAIPLTGRWALHEIDSRYEGHAYSRRQHEARTKHCQAVGDAFRQARGTLTIEEVVSSPRVAEALREILAEHSYIVRRELSTDLVHVYTSFERGMIAAHRVAPVSFYNACAELFGVSAPALSRGALVNVENEE